MKTYLQKCVILLFFTCLSLDGTSQSTGVVGKKLIVKTNLINGRLLGFNCLDLEYVMERQVTLNIGIQRFSYKVREEGIRVRSGIIQAPGNDRDEAQEYSILRDGRTKGWMASFGFKYYFNKIIPAPYGFYFGVNFGVGSATYLNYRTTYDIELLNSYQYKESHKRPDSPSFSGKSGVILFEPGLGYQAVVKRLIVLDAKVCYQSQTCTLSEEMLNYFEHNYYVRSNVWSLGRNETSHGLAIYVKLGILLF